MKVDFRQTQYYVSLIDDVHLPVFGGDFMNLDGDAQAAPANIPLALDGFLGSVVHSTQETAFFRLALVRTRGVSEKCQRL